MFTTIYLTGLVVSMLWLCLSREVTDPYKRFALCVGWPLAFLFGIYLFVMAAVKFMDDVDKGLVNPYEYFMELFSGPEECADGCCGHDHDEVAEDTKTKRKTSS